MKLVRKLAKQQKAKSSYQFHCLRLDSVTSGVPQGSVLGPVLFIIYINGIDVGLNNFVSKFADDTKLGNSVITDCDMTSLQEDLRKISEWSQRWEMPFNVKKCQILQVGTRNQKFEYEMNGTKSKAYDLSKTLVLKLRQA